jgi:hypothetical protein
MLKFRRRREGPPPFDYETTVRLLAERGVAHAEVQFESMPPDNLTFVRDCIAERFARRPLVGLHIGNFVGVSLAGFADALRNVHQDSTTVAIDPNVVTNGIDNPQQHVIGILDYYQLLGSVLLLSSFSFENTARSGVEPVEVVLTSGVNALPQLARLGVRFDVALVDGNHKGSTVSREVEWLRDRLNPGAVVFLDDVTDAWHEVQDVFNKISSDTGSGFVAVGHDGRVGALQLV